MKKIIASIFLIIIMYYVGSYFDISNTMYVAYIHFKILDGKYNATFLAPSSVSVGKTDGESKSSSTILSVSDKQISGIFNKANASTVFDINYRHVVSVIFDESCMKKEVLNEFIDYTINNKLFDFSFYLFTSTSEASDLFSFKNPENESSYYSLLNVNTKSIYLYKFARPLHYIEFLRKYDNGESILIPVVKDKKVFDIDGKKEESLELSGMCCFKNDKLSYLDKYKHEDAIYFSNFSKGTYYAKDDGLILKSNKVKIKALDKLYIDISSYNDSLRPINKNIIENQIENRLYKLKDYMYNNDFDYFNIDRINTVHNKNYNKDDIVIDFKIIP